MLEQKILMEKNHARTLNLNRWPQSKIAIGFGEKHMSFMRPFFHRKTVQLINNLCIWNHCVLQLCSEAQIEEGSRYRLESTLN